MIDASILLQGRNPEIETPMQAQGQVLSLSNLGQQNQLLQQQVAGAQLENQMRQTQLGGMQALNDAYRSAFTKNDDGSMTFNRDAITQHLAQSGYGHMIPQVMQSLTQMEKSAADAQKANADAREASANYVGSVASGIRGAGYDPGAAVLAIAHATGNGLLDRMTAAGLIGQIQASPTPATVKSIVDPLIQASPTERQRDAEAATAAGNLARGQSQLQNSGRQAQQQAIKNAASLLGAASSQAQYQAIYSKLDKDTQASFPSPDQWTKDTPGIALRAGMSPDEIAAQTRLTNQNAQTQARENARDQETRRHNQVTEAQGWQRIDQGDTRLDQSQERLDRGTGANGVQARFEQREIDQNRRLLDQIHAQRTAIGNALAVEDGEQYVDPKTGQIAKQEMDDNVRRTLESQFNNLTNQGERIMKKYGGPASGNQIGANEFQDRAPVTPQSTPQQAPAKQLPSSKAAQQQAPQNNQPDPNQVISVKVPGGTISLPRGQMKKYLASKGMQLVEAPVKE